MGMKVFQFYHASLRILALSTAVLLVLVSGLLNDRTKIIGQYIDGYVATVIGVSASVEPTELNQRTAALTARERQLDQREEALMQREIAVNLGSANTVRNDESKTTFFLSIGLFILLVLIIMNYALDYSRAREQLETVRFRS